MRKFYLELDGTRIPLNNEWSFNNTMRIMFANPEGLGLTLDLTYAKIQNGFFYRTKTEQSQNEIAGSLIIFGDPYNNYLTFANTILGASEIIFVYKPDGDNASGVEYKAKVALSYMTKSESVMLEYIVIPIAFKFESLWYTDTVYTGNYRVNLTASVQTGYGVKVVSTGTEIVNPLCVFRIYDDATETTYHDYNALSVSATVLSTSTFEYSTFYDDSHVQMTLTDGTVTDLIPSTSTSNDIFTHATSACSVILTNSESSITPAITVTQRKYWRTV